MRHVNFLKLQPNLAIVRHICDTVMFILLISDYIKFLMEPIQAEERKETKWLLVWVFSWLFLSIVFTVLTHNLKDIWWRWFLSCFADLALAFYIYNYWTPGLLTFSAIGIMVYDYFVTFWSLFTIFCTGFSSYEDLEETEELSEVSSILIQSTNNYSR